MQTSEFIKTPRHKYEVYRNAVTLYEHGRPLSSTDRSRLNVFAAAQLKTEQKPFDEATLNPPYPGSKLTYTPTKKPRYEIQTGFLQWLKTHSDWFTEIGDSSAAQGIGSDPDAVVQIATDGAAAGGDPQTIMKQQQSEIETLQKALKEQEMRLSEKLAAEMEKKFEERAAAERDQIKTLLEAKLAENVNAQTEVLTKTISSSISLLAARIDSMTLQRNEANSSTGAGRAQDNSSSVPDARARVTGAENAEGGSDGDRSTAATGQRTDTCQPRVQLGKRTSESDMEDGGNQSIPPGERRVVKQIKHVVRHLLHMVRLEPVQNVTSSSSTPP